MAQRGTVKLIGPEGEAAIEWERHPGGGYEVWQVDTVFGRRKGEVRSAGTHKTMMDAIAEELRWALEEVM